MATRTVLLAAGLLVVTTAGAQPPPDVPTAPPLLAPPAPVVGSGPVVPQSTPPLIVPAAPPGDRTPPALPRVEVAPVEKSIEQLLKELEEVQAQKADLLKREANLKAAVQKKLESIQKQVDKLGAGQGAGAGAGQPAGPNRVRRVVLMGFGDKDEKAVNQVVAKAGLVPGAALDKPTMDRVQSRLGEAGYPGVSFEVIRPEPTQPQIADIRLHAPRGDQ